MLVLISCNGKKENILPKPVDSRVYSKQAFDICTMSKLSLSNFIFWYQNWILCPAIMLFLQDP